MSLFEAWYALELNTGKRQVEVLADLNAACGTHYKSNWITQIQQAKQGLSRAPLAVRHYMAERVLRDRLGQILTEDQLNELISALQ